VPHVVALRGEPAYTIDVEEVAGAGTSAVELFEEQVFALGGDLMVDEPPVGREGTPDDARFRLPLRRADESASDYVRRMDQASRELRKHRRDR
jgi:hypothetical protein